MDVALVSRAEAIERLRTLDLPGGEGAATESVPLSAIEGRILADPFVAAEDRPPVDRATMDGFAIDATAGYPLSVSEGRIGPADDRPALEAGTAVRIATGAPLPAGANAVLKREEATVADGSLRGPPVEPGTFVHERGSDVAAGEVLLAAGERLAPRHAILFADLGVERVAVRARPTAAIVATGTEIHEGRQTDRDSAMLAGLLSAWGGAPTLEGTVPDDPVAVRERLSALATDYDLVVTSGGTSVGAGDYVVDALRDLGEVVFHGVAVRPGKPLAVARLPSQDALALAIPGKPIGALTIASLVLRPAFVGTTRLPTVEARLPVATDVGPEGFEYAIPVTLRGRDGGQVGSSAADGGGTQTPTPDPTGDEVPTAMPLGHGAGPNPLYDEVFDPSVLSASPRAALADGFFLAESGREADALIDVVPYAALR